MCSFDFIQKKLDFILCLLTHREQVSQGYFFVFIFVLFVLPFVLPFVLIVPIVLAPIWPDVLTDD